MKKIARAIGSFFMSSFISFFIGCPLFVFYVLISSLFVKWHTEQDATQIVLAVGSVLEGLLTLFIAGVLFLATLFMPVKMFNTYSHTQLTRLYLPMLIIFYAPVFIFTYMLFESATIVAYLSVPYLVSVTLTMHFYFKHMVEGFMPTMADEDIEHINEPEQLP